LTDFMHFVVLVAKLSVADRTSMAIP
jgi:hypothetical protein